MNTISLPSFPDSPFMEDTKVFRIGPDIEQDKLSDLVALGFGLGWKFMAMSSNRVHFTFVGDEIRLDDVHFTSLRSLNEGSRAIVHDKIDKFLIENKLAIETTCHILGDQVIKITEFGKRVLNARN